MRGGFALLAAGATAAAGAPAPAAAEPAEPAAAARPTAERPAAERPVAAAHERSGLALGVELGEPAAATAAWFRGPLSAGGALGTGTFGGPGLSLHADVQYIVHRLAPAVPVRVGLGGRYYRHGYDAMSADEIPDAHYGVRASAAVALERGPLQLYAEIAPGVDVHRTRSCTFASGADSICPHAQESPLFLQVGVGARWFLSR